MGAVPVESGRLTLSSAMPMEALAAVSRRGFPELFTRQTERNRSFESMEKGILGHRPPDEPDRGSNFFRYHQHLLSGF